uniref:(northern house mosquito) hypothetical protein n=1 Tax=Culex pipiens TaxID=7175 RepID=A0A8D8BTA9_CULPI
MLNILDRSGSQVLKHYSLYLSFCDKLFLRILDLSITVIVEQSVEIRKKNSTSTIGTLLSISSDSESHDCNVMHFYVVDQLLLEKLLPSILDLSNSQVLLRYSLFFSSFHALAL